MSCLPNDALLEQEHFEASNAYSALYNYIGNHQGAIRKKYSLISKAITNANGGLRKVFFLDIKAAPIFNLYEAEDQCACLL